jgi:ankyrin repeat protein
MPRPLLSKIKSQLSFRQRLPPSESNKLVKLVLKQKWEEVLQFLADRCNYGSSCCALAVVDNMHEDLGGTASIHIRRYNDNGCDFRQGNILHVMCEQHPPARVVHRVASLFPLLTAQVNAQKQTPLHVAAANGASHRVIATLLQKGGNRTALLQDSKGRTPLHAHVKYCTSNALNCDPGDNDEYRHTSMSAMSSSVSSSTGTASSAGRNGSIGGMSRSSSMSHSSQHNNTCRGALSASSLVYGPNIKVLRLLAEAAPQTIHMVDHDGKSPMSMASSTEREQEISLRGAGAMHIHTMMGGGNTRTLNSTDMSLRRAVFVEKSQSCHGNGNSNRRNSTSISMRNLSDKIASTVRRRSSLLLSDNGNANGNGNGNEEEDNNDNEEADVTMEMEMDQDETVTLKLGDARAMTMTMTNTARPSSRTTLITQHQPSESERDMQRLNNPLSMDCY